MNFDYDFSSSSAALIDVRMISHHPHQHHHQNQNLLHNHHSHQQLLTPYNQNMVLSRNNSSNADELNSSNHNFECLINDVDVSCIANEGKSDEENDVRFEMNANENQSMLHKNLTNIQLQHQQQSLQNQLQMQDENICFKGKQQQASSRSVTNFSMHPEINQRYSNEINSNKFYYVLMAPTSPAVKLNEDTLTYLNQGQNYELRISRSNNVSHVSSAYLSDQRQIEDIKPLIIEPKLNRNSVDSSQTTLNQIVCGNNNDSESSEKTAYQNLNDVNIQSNNSMFLSIVRVCFWDRKLQEIEQEEIKEVSYFIRKFVRSNRMIIFLFVLITR
jgi:hypothetical protein